ncbi:TetR/AcrR family transcriptional regulator [Halomicrobium salinisoli]|uniref:TetR/AcrR family transcriptional regulator n=1 Tax=Halomicrobium salinisoli TaxID=2878391 RepID=UPI001CF02A72|nr:TetR/AcrR family transcriptional regulator [Halomicrobium salinisoli]
MADEIPFLGEPSDSREAIMHATYAALTKHGYAGLSIQRIADEADLSKSTFYHHFDDKDDLLRAFVDFVLEAFGQALSARTSDDPVEALWTYVDLLLASDEIDVLDIDLSDDLLESYVELRAQAVHDDELKERFARRDEAIREQLADVVREGIDRGAFREVDAEAAATFILTVNGGHLIHRTTSAQDDTDVVRSQLEAYVRGHLLVDGDGEGHS